MAGGWCWKARPARARPQPSISPPAASCQTGVERPVRLLAAAALQQAQAQRIQLDKAFGIALVIDLVGLEGDMGEAVEGFRRFAPDQGGRTLVELEAHGALDMLLALVDQRLEHLAFRAEPEAVVDHLGITGHQL